jgi:D-arginine dehydrogenase
VITFDPPDGVDIVRWPLLIDADEEFYLKPEGAQLLASPCDETPFAPCDVTPDEFEVALAADRVMRATTLEIRHIQQRWAGLRSFVADRAPVIGMDLEVPGLCWMAGQGGSGIMTAPSAARAAASMIVDGALPADLKALGITPEMLAPSRPALRSEVPES